MLQLISFFLAFLCSCRAMNTTVFSEQHLRKSSNFTRQLTPAIKLTMYNNIRGYLNWHEPWFAEYMQKNCNYCSFSTVPATARSADMVIFLASTFRKSSPPFPPKQPHQLFTIHTMEQPKYVPMMLDKRILSRFDLVATYSQAQ